MRLELPDCDKCGAAIQSRSHEHCPYCGAVLPWELWDEICRSQVELIEVDERQVQRRLFEIEQSEAFKVAEFQASRSRRRRIRLKGSIRRPGGGAADDLGLIAAGLTVLASVFLWLMLRQPIVFALPVAVGGAIAAARTRRIRKRRAGRRDRGRSAARRVFKTLACVVLEVTPPRRHHPQDERPTRRVVLGTSSGKERIVVVDADSTIAPAELGIAQLSGMRLVDFDVHGRAAGVR